MPRSQYAGLELNSKLTLSKQWGPSPKSGKLGKGLENLARHFLTPRSTPIGLCAGAGRQVPIHTLFSMFA
jgi:hypothetical protein